ncbi:hypothetical protein AB0H17_26990 [Streptomyces olivoreticuli]
MLGHTIDHRLRISLGAPTGQPISEGVLRTILDDEGWPAPEVIATVQAAGMELLAELHLHEDGAGQPLALEAQAEERLIRMCHLASGFEAIYRCSGWIRGNSLGFCAPGATLDDLADAVPGYVIDDIRQQMALAASPGPFTRFRDLPAHKRICGPVFDGSAHVGGADADFILGGALIDCKATIRPQRLTRRDLPDCRLPSPRLQRRLRHRHGRAVPLTPGRADRLGGAGLSPPARLTTRAARTPCSVPPRTHRRR